MFNDNPIIICGSGNSIPFNLEQYKQLGNGLPEELRTLIVHNYSLGLNSFYKYGCPTTALTFVDAKFYVNNLKAIQNVPFIVGKFDDTLAGQLYSNTLLLPQSKYFFGLDSWSIKEKKCLVCGYKVLLNDRAKKCPTCSTYLWNVGFYHTHLNGLFSLTLAIALGFKEIYLLGYDGKEINDKTHFYQDLVKDFLVYSGVGKTLRKDYRCSTFNNTKKMNEQWFAPYSNLEGIKIYNVSTDSVIDTFPKIDYATFYEKIGKRSVNQEEARNEIKQFILEKTK